MTDSLVVSDFKIASTRRTAKHWHDVSDRQLVGFCLQNMEEAWAELLRRYHRLILGVLIKTIPASLRWSSLLLDLSQEVLAKICANSCRALREFEWRHDGSLRGLLQVISSTVAQDYLRRSLTRRRDVRRELPLDEFRHDRKPHDSHSAIDRKILLEQLARRLGQRIQHEPNRTRDIAMFLLYYGYGLRSVELAKLYRLKTKTVENKLAKFCRLVRMHCDLKYQCVGKFSALQRVTGAQSQGHVSQCSQGATTTMTSQ
jgi:DNA-directed RNA polymerase specialized sigma24 family protein